MLGVPRQKTLGGLAMPLLHLRSGLPAGMPRGSLRALVFFICHIRGGMKNSRPVTSLREAGRWGRQMSDVRCQKEQARLGMGCVPARDAGVAVAAWLSALSKCLTVKKC